MWNQRRCLRTESASLPHEVVECIMERLPAKSLQRFRAVSKQWRSTIESASFKGRQLIHGQSSGDPEVFMSGLKQSIRTLVLGSSSPVAIPTPREMKNRAYVACRSSCDGLVCLYHPENLVFVVNPTTRWHRALPLCDIQGLRIRFGKSYSRLGHRMGTLGFGKDKSTGTYKAVWLYNSAEIGLENATTCEVFDFRSNAWSYVTPAAPCRIAGSAGAVCVDGSLHWLAECGETKVVSFDLHTQAFHVISAVPSANAKMVMCNLDNRLCISVMKSQSYDQVIWSFNSGDKTWYKLCSIHMDFLPYWSEIPKGHSVLPLALLNAEERKKKKKKRKKRLLFSDRWRTLVTHELETVYYDDAFSTKSIGDSICYFPSLISI